MKKIITLLLVMLAVLSMVTVVSAETTTMTFTVPEADYTLVVPRNIEIPYKANAVQIGTIFVENASGFAAGRNLHVSVTLNPFTCADTDTVMPFTLGAVQAEIGQTPFEFEGTVLMAFEGYDDGTVDRLPRVLTNTEGMRADQWFVCFDAEDWNSLKPGDYTGSIVFNAFVSETPLPKPGEGDL